MNTAPKKVMGSQGNSATIPTSHFQNKAVKHTKFPGGTKAKNAPSKPFNHGRGDG